MWFVGVLGQPMKIKIVAAVAALLILPGSAAFAQVVSSTGAGSGSSSSWLAGVHAGHNWQSGSVVYGIETDFSGTALKTDFNTVLQGAIVPAPVANTDANIEYFGTLRGRLGWAAGPVLFYGTGGLAYGNVDTSSTITSPVVAFSAQTNDSRIGWAGGGGIEYKYSPNVIFSLNYLYVDLGNVGFSTPTLGFGPAVTSGNVHAQLQAVTLGVSWLFAPDDKGPHAPWEGNYIGGQAGGDWGNNTSASYLAQPTAISDIRLKRDIMRIGQLDNGLTLYRYRYLWSDTVYVGVMAQEVAEKAPNAVVMGEDGYLRVDYRTLGLQLRTQAEWDALTYGIRLD
jgi:outer membrane immunogenic protein